jgi:glycerate kinase
VSSLSAAEARGAGLAGVHTLSDVEPDRRRCVEQAADLLVVATERMVRASLGTDALGRITSYFDLKNP